MVDEFPGNSNQSKEARTRPANPKAANEPKKIEKIVTGEVVQRKKPLSKRFKETFFRVSPRDVFGMVASDVLIPAMKDMIADAGRESLERAIFGEARSRSRGGYGGPVGRTRYNGIPQATSHAGWRPASQEPRREVSARGRATHNFSEIVMDSRGEAEQVLDTMFEIVDQYGEVSVSDLYQLVGITPAYTDGKWGWTKENLQGARAEHVRGGAYLLNLPRPVPLT